MDNPARHDSEPGAVADSSLHSPSTTALNEFLVLMEDTESPREYLIWSLISVCAALIGDNTRFRSGPFHSVCANLYVILLGPPAAKKSSAIQAVMQLVESTSLNYGPTDTGGQRHGLMAALSGLHKRGRVGSWYGDEATLPPMEPHHIAPRNPGDMFMVSSELGRLMGSSSPEMADFFVDLWDGVGIRYETKAGEIRIKSPRGNMLGGTTPSSLANILPNNAPDHGILTRMLFIYADTPHKLVPLPPAQSPAWYESWGNLKERLAWVDRNRFDYYLSPEAERRYEKLYAYLPVIDDPRMAPYRGRRGILLMKVAMILAALRNDIRINIDDLEVAHSLLQDVEPRMHKALEYFGRSKSYHGRMLMVNYLKQVPGKIATQAELLNAAASELTQREAQEALTYLESQGTITQYGGTGKYMLNQSTI